MGGDREYNNTKECYVKWLFFCGRCFVGTVARSCSLLNLVAVNPAEKTGPMAPIITFVARVQDGMLLVSVDCRAAAF